MSTKRGNNKRGNQQSHQNGNKNINNNNNKKSVNKNGPTTTKTVNDPKKQDNNTNNVKQSNPITTNNDNNNNTKSTQSTLTAEIAVKEATPSAPASTTSASVPEASSTAPTPSANIPSELTKLMEQQNGDDEDSENDFNVIHPLQNEWTLWWFNSEILKPRDDADWLKLLKQISSFSTVESFWSVYNNIPEPSRASDRTDYSFFKKGIQPSWEDPKNKNGGKWTLAFPNNNHYRDSLDKYWLYSTLALMGEMFGDLGDEIYGVVVNIRKGGDKLSLWLSSKCTDEALCKNIGLRWKALMELKENLPLGYQSHVVASKSRNYNQYSLQI